MVAEPQFHDDGTPKGPVGLPVAVFESPPGPAAFRMPGDPADPTRFVVATGRTWAYDPDADRVYLATVPGQRIREEYARKLGLQEGSEVLRWVEAS